MDEARRMAGFVRSGGTKSQVAGFACGSPWSGAVRPSGSEWDGFLHDARSSSGRGLPRSASAGFSCCVPDCAGPGCRSRRPGREPVTTGRLHGDDRKGAAVWTCKEWVFLVGGNAKHVLLILGVRWSRSVTQRTQGSGPVVMVRQEQRCRTNLAGRRKGRVADVRCTSH